MATVTIIGAGGMAHGIGVRAVAAGADVQVLARQPDEATELATTLVEGGSGSAVGGPQSEPVTGEIVVLALPYDGALAWVAEHGHDLEDKVVIDITNPVDRTSFDGLVTPPGSSAAEEIARRLPHGVPVVKAFNTTFAGTLPSGAVAGQPLDVLLAADDTDAKQTVTLLVEQAALRAIDAGPLRRSRQLEQLGFLHMALQEPLGTESGSAVKFLS